MAVYEETSVKTKLLIKDSAGNPFGFIEINEGGEDIDHLSYHFTVMVLDVNGVSYYLWPAVNGKLKYGTTCPTDHTTQASAGTYISP